MGTTKTEENFLHSLAQIYKYENTTEKACVQRMGNTKCMTMGL